MADLKLIENPVEMSKMAEISQTFYSAVIHKNETPNVNYGKFEAKLVEHHITGFDPVSQKITGYTTHGSVTNKFTRQCVEFFSYRYKLHSTEKQIAQDEVDRLNKSIYEYEGQICYPATFFLKKFNLKNLTSFEINENQDLLKVVEFKIGYFLSIADINNIINKILPQSKILDIDFAINNENIPLLIMHTALKDMVIALDDNNSDYCCYDNEVIGGPLKIVQHIAQSTKSSSGFG